MSFTALLKKLVPHALKKAYRKVVPAPPDGGWFGDYPDWTSAQLASGGYDSSLILNKVREATLKVKRGQAVAERDSVLLERIEIQQEICNLLQEEMDRHHGHLKVIDFGGSLGSLYFQYRQALRNIQSIHWCVVEQNHYVECGLQEIADESLNFDYSIEAARKSNAEIILLSSVIQYLPDPYAFLNKLVGYGFKYIIFDRNSFNSENRNRITVQKVPSFIYDASYPCWFLHEEQFLKTFAENYTCISTFKSEISTDQLVDHQVPVYWKGFIFKRKEP